MTKLSERLKHVRKIHNISQDKLAEIAGTTQQAIQQAETGKARQPRYLHQLASRLDVPVNWLVLGEEVVDESFEKKSENGLSEKQSDVLDHFFSMPKADQKLIFELMKSRQKES